MGKLIKEIKESYREERAKEILDALSNPEFAPLVEKAYGCDAFQQFKYSVFDEKPRTKLAGLLADSFLDVKKIHDFSWKQTLSKLTVGNKQFAIRMEVGEPFRLKFFTIIEADDYINFVAFKLYFSMDIPDDTFICYGENKETKLRKGSYAIFVAKDCAVFIREEENETVSFM